MLNSFSRTELLLGHPAMEALKHARVAVFGIGGVGGYACEALVRSGVGAFDLIDDDKVCLTNINRQIIATRKTVGQYKADVMRDRMLDINPQPISAYTAASSCRKTPQSSRFRNMITFSTPSTPSVPSSRLPCRRRQPVCRSSAPWGRATSSTAAASASPISPRRVYARWHV